MRPITARRVGEFTACLLAAKPQHTGAMVALRLPDALDDLRLHVREQLPSGATFTPAGELHVTLAYLGEAAQYDAATQAAIARAVNSVALRWPPVEGQIGGLARFAGSGDDDGDPIVALYDAPSLPELRQDLVAALAQAGAQVARNHGFTPHITLAYVPGDAPTPDLRAAAKTITVERIGLWLAGAVTTYAFRGRNP